jgi:hypothetical protein
MLTKDSVLTPKEFLKATLWVLERGWSPLLPSAAATQSGKTVAPTDPEAEQFRISGALICIRDSLVQWHGAEYRIARDTLERLCIPWVSVERWEQFATYGDVLGLLEKAIKEL